MLGVLLCRVDQGLSHGRGTFCGDALHRVKPQGVQQGDPIVTVLAVNLACFHWPVIFSLKGENNSTCITKKVKQIHHKGSSKYSFVKIKLIHTTQCRVVCLL